MVCVLLRVDASSELQLSPIVRPVVVDPASVREDVCQSAFTAKLAVALRFLAFIYRNV